MSPHHLSHFHGKNSEKSGHQVRGRFGGVEVISGQGLKEKQQKVPMTSGNMRNSDLLLQTTEGVNSQHPSGYPFRLCGDTDQQGQHPGHCAGCGCQEPSNDAQYGDPELPQHLLLFALSGFLNSPLPRLLAATPDTWPRRTKKGQPLGDYLSQKRL